MQKIIAKLLLLVLVIQVVPITTAHAQSDQTQQTNPGGDTSLGIDTGDGLAIIDETQDQPAKTNLATISELVTNIQGRRGANGTTTIENTLPRLGMSQCDQQLVRQGKIDERILKALNYLVDPKGAGITYLQVTFSKSCEEQVPDTIGGAYPVIFPGEKEDPANPGYPLLKTQTLAELDQMPNQTGANASNSVLAQGVHDLANVLSPLVRAADTSASDVEPSGVENVHNNGQAVDITAAGLVMCTKKSGGVFGVGASVSREAPRPIKVAWQTDQGVANVQSPFGSTFDQMAQTAGLDQFLEGFSSQDGTYQAQALNGAFTMMGFQLLAGLAGVRPGTFDPRTSSLNYSTIGYALLADTFNLPDASVFNPFTNGDPNGPQNPYKTGHNNVETLLQTAALRSIEKDLKLAPGSLQGDNVTELMKNAGLRALEQQLGLTPAGLTLENFKNPDDALRSIGQSSMETYFHWAKGTAGLNGGQGNNLNNLMYNLSQQLGLSGANTIYAEKQIRGALNLPASANLTELSFKDSGFWKSDQGKATRQTLQKIDAQLFPGANSSQAIQSIFDKGNVPIVDTVLGKARDDLTFKMITGDMSLKDYETIIGTGKLLTQYGTYADAMRAFDLPLDSTATSLLGRVTTYKNAFLGNILKGDDNALVALGVNTIAKSLQQHPDQRTTMVNDALAGKRNFPFSGAGASLSTSLSPTELLSVLGSFLATDKNGANAEKRAQARKNTILTIAKQQFNNMFDTATQRALGDQSLVQQLYQYDKSRPDKHSTVDRFVLGDAGQKTFRLTERASKIDRIIIEGEGAKDSQADLASDGYTITVKQDDIQAASGGDALVVVYTAYARKASSPAQITTDTLSSLLNDEKALQSLAIDYGAMKVSTGLNLPPTALSSAAGLLKPTSTGIAGLGESALEQSAGISVGTLKGDTLDASFKAGLTVAQLERMLRLPSGWYNIIKNFSQDDFQQSTIPNQVLATDDYYHIEGDSTNDLIRGKITLKDYKQRVGQAQIRYQAGGILASQFNIQALGYRLNAQDFDDIISGSYYKVAASIGARATERNHGMPIGALANSLLTGDHSVSLFTLGTNVVASTFHLQSIDLSHATSLAGIKQAVGESAVEQALGFKASTFYGSSLLDVVQHVGAENFAQAFGIPMPKRITDKLAQNPYIYNADQARAERNNIIYSYLESLLATSPNTLSPGEEELVRDGRFSDQTLARFAAIDHTLGTAKNTTYSFINGTISPDEYIKKSSQKTVESGITGSLSNALGIPEAYGIEGKNIINALTDNKKDNDPAAYNSFRKIVEQAGGINFDSTVGWDKGTFEHILTNFNNVQEIRKTTILQGAKKLGRFIGLTDKEFQVDTIALSGNSAADGQQLILQLGAGKISSLTRDKNGNDVLPITDANQMLNGHFADGLQMFGIALMANSKDMQEAHISYDEIKKSILGSPTESDEFTKQQYLIDQQQNDSTALAQDADTGQIITALSTTPVNYPYLETTRRQYMTNARQAISYKYMDFEAKQLLGDIPVPAGFAQALLGGKYSYTDAGGKTQTLTGDAARWKMGNLVLTQYAIQNIDVFKNIGGTFSSTLLEFLTPGSTSAPNPNYLNSDWLQGQLTANNGAGFKAIGNGMDGIAQKLFGVKMQSGTGAALLGYAFNGNSTILANGIWDAWKGQALGWADHAFGLRQGTANVIYQGIVGYQQALGAYQAASASAIFDFASNIGSGFDPETAFKLADKELSNAGRTFKTQQAMIIAAVAGFVFQKQIGQIESALGLASGTLMYLIQYLIHPDPISLGLFIFFNFFWGKTQVTCRIDAYRTDDTPPAVQSLQTALKDSVGITPTTPDQSSATTITKLLSPPKSFNGLSNDSYRAGIKAGAQYEVRRVIGSLILMKRKTGNATLLPTQIGTYSADDVNLFENISQASDLYGPLASRGRKGPGWWDPMKDRIHVGY